ncbi:hypothetical protein [Mycolicibacterium gilvum]|uniref:hypothetical protein n=1 Tax=Mycolicibacterium gilvum TaxID=1804 RepID=UPI004045331E
MSDSDELKPTRPDEALAEASEFLSVFAGLDLDLGGGKTWRLPNPNLMAPAIKKRYLEHLRFINKELDKEKVKHPVTGKLTEQTIWPLQYKGELIDQDELLCIALMGEDVKADYEAYFKDGTVPETYEKFLNAGGIPGQVQVHWRVMALQMEERVQRDPKSR